LFAAETKSPKRNALYESSDIFPEYYIGHSCLSTGKVKAEFRLTRNYHTCCLLLNISRKIPYCVLHSIYCRVLAESLKVFAAHYPGVAQEI